MYFVIYVVAEAAFVSCYNPFEATSEIDGNTAKRYRSVSRISHHDVLNVLVSLVIGAQKVDRIESFSIHFEEHFSGFIFDPEIESNIGSLNFSITSQFLHVRKGTSVGW